MSPGKTSFYSAGPASPQTVKQEQEMTIIRRSTISLLPVHFPLSPPDEKETFFVALPANIQYCLDTVSDELLWSQHAVSLYLVTSL